MACLLRSHCVSRPMLKTRIIRVVPLKWTPDCVYKRGTYRIAPHSWLEPRLDGVEIDALSVLSLILLKVTSTLDQPHLLCAVVIASGGGELVEAVKLVWAELDVVGRDILLDTRDPLCAGDRGDVVALDEQPGQ
jgi:hypothetical protein